LKQLGLINCTESTGNQSYIPIRNLELLILDKENVNEGSVVLNHSAATLKSLMIWDYHEFNTFSFVGFDISEVLIGTDFPCLESLTFTPKLNCSKELVMSVIERFPSLKTFGIIEDEDLLNGLTQEFAERNWCVTITENDNINSVITSMFNE